MSDNSNQRLDCSNGDVANIACEQDSDSDIELPRLEDSRGSLVRLQPHQRQHQAFSDLAMLLALPQGLVRDPLLSSTMMQESGTDQDWPTASSIGLGNSHGSLRLSEQLNNADICLEASTATDVSALSPTAESAPAESSSAAGAAAVDGPDGDATSDASIASISASEDDVDDSDSDDRESSPRLRVLASATVRSGSGTGLPPAAAQQHLVEQHQHHHQHQHQHQHQQYALGLLQVCRLTLDVLSEGGLLCPDARSWLTPEMLCDKLCARLHCPQPQPAATAGAAPPSVTGSSAAGAAAAAASAAAAFDFESPSGRVREWLLTVGAAGVGCPDLSGSPLRRHVTNSV